MRAATRYALAQLPAHRGEGGLRFLNEVRGLSEEAVLGGALGGDFGQFLGVVAVFIAQFAVGGYTFDGLAGIRS